MAARCLGKPGRFTTGSSGVSGYPPEIVVAEPQHRWGVAPYHYIEAYYRHAIDALRKLTVPA